MKKIDEQAFDRIKKVAGNISQAKKMAGSPPEVSGVPNVIGLKLTNRCNLRCRHCYEWNEDGYHHHLTQEYQNADLDLRIAEKCVRETRRTDAMFYLWGGEPLLYRDMVPLLQLLCAEKRYTTICTNGTLLDRFYGQLLPFGEKLELLLAIDGDRASHDALRGEGNFDRIMKQIRPLLRKKKAGEFQGVLSVHTMISNENLLRFYETLHFLDELGMDTVTVCLPWYISRRTGREMDDYFRRHFSHLNRMVSGVPSWYAYQYRITPERFELVEETLDRIRNSPFRMNIKFQPDIQGEELRAFLAGAAIGHCDSRECYTVFSRMDVLPNGLVTSCKHFQELAYGDLKDHSLAQVWNSQELAGIRQAISRRQMPVCSKCNNLYLHSYRKR